jgi:hypothetical protein
MAQSNRNSQLGKRSFSQLEKDIKYAPDEYQFFKNNEQFANSYVNTYLTNLLESELIPDILMEVISEMTDMSRINNERQQPLQSDIYIRNTTNENLKFTNTLKYDGSK